MNDLKLNGEELKTVYHTELHITPVNKRKRYPDNCGDYTCEICKECVPNEEKNHELYNCSKMHKVKGIVCHRTDPMHLNRIRLNQLAINTIKATEKQTYFSWDPGR